MERKVESKRNCYSDVKWVIKGDWIDVSRKKDVGGKRSN